MDIEELARNFGAHHTEVKALLSENEKSQKALAVQVSDLQQKIARRNNYSGSNGDDNKKTLGEAFASLPDFATKVATLANERGKATLTLDTKAVTIIGGTGGFGGAGAALVNPMFIPDPVMLARRRIFVRDLLQPGVTESNAINYPRQQVGTRNQNAAVVSEGGLKPQSDITFELVVAAVRTIAHWSRFSRQIFDDASFFQGAIDGEMRYGLSLAEEQELLFGDGTGVHILGIIPQASVYQTARNVAGDTKFDTLAHAIAQTTAALLPATGVIMNIDDWQALRVIKNTLGNYIGESGPFGPPITSVWGLPVVGTPVMPAGQFLVGAFMDGATVWDRHNVTALVSSEDQDNWIRNLVTMLVEERIALSVRRPQAFVYGTFP